MAVPVVEEPVLAEGKRNRGREAERGLTSLDGSTRWPSCAISSSPRLVLLNDQ